MKYALTWLMLATGNFLYQGLKERQWATALERSYFQAIAILCVAVFQN